MIDLSDVRGIRLGPLILIAHRGGVVAPNAPECSLNAIRLAAEQGYQMVELDVQRSKDGMPIVFHDRDLSKATGLANQVLELSGEEIRRICFRASNQHVASLDEAFALCRELGLGVMLEIKCVPQQVLPEEHFEKIAQLIDQNGLSKAAMCFTPYPLAIKHLCDRCIFSVSGEEIERSAKGESISLRGKFLFHRPDDVPPETVAKVQKNGALAITALNEFLYPADVSASKPRQDAERWRSAGVDGFQIDSVYGSLFR